MYFTRNRKVSGYREDGLPTGPLVCISDGKSGVGRVVLDHLEHERFSVRILAMGFDVIQRVEQLHPLLVMIETTLSTKRALELCRGLRCMPSFVCTPLILLAANASEEERVLGLESGADDYITQSSSTREVVARVRAVLRRFARHELSPNLSLPFLHSLNGMLTPIVKSGDIEVDLTAMKVSVGGNDIVTTNLEFRLLYYLVHNKSRVFSRDELLEAVWGTQYVEARSVDACVRRLRRKIEPDPLRPTYLKTVRGAGYSLQVAAA